MTGNTHAERASGSDEPAEPPLEDVSEMETIGEHVSLPVIRAELPDSWRVRRDLEQVRGSSLEEVVVFTRDHPDVSIVLKPAETSEPTDRIEWYERGTATAGMEHVVTLDSLGDALRGAVNRAHQFR